MTEKITPEQAREVLEAEQKARAEACQPELDALLKKYNCHLEAPISTVTGQVLYIPVTLVANPA